MKNIIIRQGGILGKMIFANKDFKKGKVIIKYNLNKITKEEFTGLSKEERKFVHLHYGIYYLYSSPERYVNHSSNPNTMQDLKNKCDIAIRDIKKGEEITTDSSKDDI